MTSMYFDNSISVDVKVGWDGKTSRGGGSATQNIDNRI